MGIYWFKREHLYRTLLKDSKNPSSSNDFGHNIIPLLIKESTTHSIDIEFNYPWEDVGTIERYWDTHWKYQSSIPKTGIFNKPHPCLFYTTDIRIVLFLIQQQ